MTINDVARAAGVSPATVSRVLNDRGLVRGEKLQLVEAAIERLGYRPNRFASILRGGATRTVGVLVPQLEKDFYGKVVSGIERVLRANGLHMLCGLGHDTEAGEEETLGLFRERQVDGFIILADRLSDARLLELAREGKPVVLINRFLPELSASSVRIDNLAGGFEATRHLIGLGHRTIAHISGPLSRPGARARYQGYADALAEAGLKREEALVLEADFTPESGYAAMKRLLAVGGFTAVFASDDNQALGAMAALREHGVEVPRDVALIGFDDSTFAAFTTPPLSTMHYPMRQLGECAAEQLVRLSTRVATSAELIQPQLVVRATTRGGDV